MLHILRKKINYIDKQLISILKYRSFIIPKVRTIKKSWNYHIAFKREADMASFINKQDFGHYNNTYMQKIWRELISATLYIECKLTLGILKPNTQNDYFGIWEITKDHFGSASNFIFYDTWEHLQKDLLERKIDAAIVTINNPESCNTWWTSLAQQDKESNPEIFINLKLPFITTFKTLFDTQALVLSLNNKDHFPIKYYFCRNIPKNTCTDVTILHKINNNCLIETSLDISLIANIDISDIIYLGSTPKSI